MSFTVGEDATIDIAKLRDTKIKERPFINPKVMSVHMSFTHTHIYTSPKKMKART